MHNKRRWLPRWQRIELVQLCLEQGWTRREAAAWRRVSVSTVQFWVQRYRQASEADRASGVWADERPSTPHRQPLLSSERTHERVCEVRQRTGWGPRLIASELGMRHATVARCLKRRGLSRMAPTEREEIRRFEWPCPGDLLQMDTKRLARFSRPGHKVTGDRYPHTAGLHRDPPRRESPDRHSFRATCSRVLRQPRHPSQAPANGQRVVLHPHPLTRRTARRREHPAPPHPATNTEAQRQDRALSADPRQRVGLRAALPPLRRQSQSATHLAQPLQHHTQPQLPLKPATHQPRSKATEAQHLDRESAGRRAEIHKRARLLGARHLCYARRAR